MRLLHALSSPRAGLTAAIMVLMAISGYTTWYSSAGSFPTFPPIHNDYADLGHAFLHGQLSLLEKPDPQLAALPNPYDYEQRKAVPYHWDASYYNGRYYLYWGPVPGLVSALLEALTGHTPVASVLLIIPYIGLLIVFFVLLRAVSRQLYEREVGWRAIPFLLIGFINLPALYLLGSPAVYEAAILYGQFFLLAGLAGFVVFLSTGRRSLLMLSGLSWGLAVSCRYNLVISVFVYLALALLWMWRHGDRNELLRGLALLVSPLALCALGLGAYNFARFGNPLETGVGYQLSIPELQRHNFSVLFAPFNLYVYLVYPLRWMSRFPFIYSAHFAPPLLPAWLPRPRGLTFDTVIFGLSSSVPAVWLLVLALAPALQRTRQGARPSGPGESRGKLVFAMITLAAAAQFTFLVFYYYSAERYLIDFYFSMVVGMAMVVMQIDEAVRLRPVLRTALWLTVLALAVATTVIGYFSCFGVPSLVSKYYSPTMLAQLETFWNLLVHTIRS